MNDSGISDTIILLTDDQQKDEEGKKKGKYHRRNPRNFHIFTLNAKSLGGNVSFWNIFKLLKNKDMRYVLKTFWHFVEKYREIEDMTLYLLHI